MFKTRKTLSIFCFFIILIYALLGFSSNALGVTTTLDKCDSASGWSGSDAVSLDTTNMKEGAGCLTKTGSGTDWFKKVFSAPVNSGVTQTNGYV